MATNPIACIVISSIFYTSTICYVAQPCICMATNPIAPIVVIAVVTTPLACNGIPAIIPVIQVTIAILRMIPVLVRGLWWCALCGRTQTL